MKVYMTEDGVMMRLSNGELLDKPLTAEEASQKNCSILNLNSVD